MFVKDVVLEVDNLKIAGQLYLPTGRTSCPAVCVCHGIPFNPPDPNDKGYPLLAERICHQGFVAFIFNFRGTGTSDGNFDILGWTRDLKAVIDYLCSLPEVDRARLTLLGFSGGAAVSLYVAARDKRISAIVACACPAEFTGFAEGEEPQSVIDRFRNIGAIRDRDFPHSVEEWLGSFKLVSPIKYVAEIAPRTLLLVHGSQDEVVDVSHAHRLYDKAGESKQLVIVDGAEHKLRQNEEAMAIVISWLKSRC